MLPIWYLLMNVLLETFTMFKNILYRTLLINAISIDASIVFLLFTHVSFTHHHPRAGDFYSFSPWALGWLYNIRKSIQSTCLEMPSRAEHFLSVYIFPDAVWDLQVKKNKNTSYSRYWWSFKTLVFIIAWILNIDVTWNWGEIHSAVIYDKILSSSVFKHWVELEVKIWLKME